jgi:hypothetical protein
MPETKFHTHVKHGEIATKVTTGRGAGYAPPRLMYVPCSVGTHPFRNVVSAYNCVALKSSPIPNDSGVHPATCTSFLTSSCDV